MDIPGQTGWPNTCAVAVSLLFTGQQRSLESDTPAGLPFQLWHQEAAPELGDCQYINPQMLSHTEVTAGAEGKEGQSRVWDAVWVGRGSRTAVLPMEFEVGFEPGLEEGGSWYVGGANRPGREGWWGEGETVVEHHVTFTFAVCLLSALRKPLCFGGGAGSPGDNSFQPPAGWALFPRMWSISCLSSSPAAEGMAD